MHILDNCSSKVIPYCKGKNVYEVSIGEDTFNGWCEGLFTKIMGQRIHPHLMRSSRVTNLVVYDHRDLETAQKLLGHESSETTKIYVVKNDDSDAFEAFI